ncbi:MAG TPA: hypothetical protein DCS93_24715 [Microscillaceae bacterium]|nr:hypothetical protein [Microscillaceae bacterium]
MIWYLLVLGGLVGCKAGQKKSSESSNGGKSKSGSNVSVPSNEQAEINRLAIKDGLLEVGNDSLKKEIALRRSIIERKKNRAKLLDTLAMLKDSLLTLEGGGWVPMMEGLLQQYLQRKSPGKSGYNEQFQQWTDALIQDLPRLSHKGFILMSQTLTNQVFAMNQVVDDYVKRVKENASTYLKLPPPVMKVESLEESIFRFNEPRVTQRSGVKRIQQLVAEVKKRIKKYYKNTEIVIQVKVVAYTDGSPINKYRRKLIKNFGLPQNASNKLLKRCLTQTRAEEVYRLIVKRLPGYVISGTLSGEGDRLAEGSQASNPKLQRIDIYFTLSVVK